MSWVEELVPTSIPGPETEDISNWQAGFQERGLVLEILALGSFVDETPAHYIALVLSRQAHKEALAKINKGRLKHYDRCVSKRQNESQPLPEEFKPLEFLRQGDIANNPLSHESKSGALAVRAAHQKWQEYRHGAPDLAQDAAA